MSFGYSDVLSCSRVPPVPNGGVIVAVIQPNVINVEQVAPEQKVVFNIQSGNILITSHATQTLEFSWHLLSGDEEKVTVETSTSADAATVTAKVRSDNYGPGTSLAIEAAVPDVSRLEVEAAGGSIGIAAHNGPVVARASGGNVTLGAAGGPPDVTVNGGNLPVGRAPAGVGGPGGGGGGGRRGMFWGGGERGGGRG